MKTHIYNSISLYIIIALVAALGYGVYLYRVEQGKLVKLSADYEELGYNFSKTMEEKTAVEGALAEEKSRNSAFQSQIGEITGTLNKLDKLAKTDPELLQKYSKVFFLNEHYTPRNLTNIPEKYLYDKKKITQILASTSPYLFDMLGKAARDGVNLEIISAYRSFGDQSSLKGNYTVTYGSGANRFSADQGYSEHQLGTTLDFTSASLGANFTNFAKSDEYKWLTTNAYKYGFVLSYPENNAYYQFEPWHWRFVGKKLAERLWENKEYFYDMNQRAIDAYLIDIFE